MKERCHNYTEEDKARVLRKRIETNMSKYGVPCALRSEQALEKTKQTLLARYGVENVLLSPEIKERVRSTNRERYGVDNPFSSPVIQEKIRETSIYTYGVDNPAKSAGVQAKITATNQERYGVDVVFQAEVIKERSKATCLEKYGVPYASMDEQIKARTRETNMRVYGFENPAASDVVKRKIEQSFKYYDFTFPSGTSVKVQGYEGQYITALLDKGVPEESIVIRPREFEYTHPSGKLRRYRPDVYLTTEDFFYEVKSTYTLYRYVWENIAKAEGVIKAGCNLMFVVLSEKGKIKEQVTLDVLRARSENSDQPQWWKEYEWYR